ncbi:MAG: hypothetical protein ABIK28_06170 [Planctomycetota bacterium]
MLSTLFIRHKRSLCSQAGLISCLFLLGISMGIMMTGFIYLPKLGFEKAAYCAALHHGIFLSIMIIVARSLFRRSLSLDSSLLVERPLNPMDFMSEIRSSVLFAAIFCSAFSAAVLYILWFRILVFFLGDSASAYIALSAVYFMALSLGVGLFGLIARSFEPGLITGSTVLFIGGALACLGIHSVPALYDLTGPMAIDSAQSGTLDMIKAAFYAGGALFIPSAMLMSMILPLALGYQMRMRGAACRVSGLLLSALFFGSCSGMLATSRFILPALTLKLGVMIASFMVLAAGLLMLIFTAVEGWKKSALFLINLVLIYLLAWIMTDQGRLSRPLIVDSELFRRTVFDSHFLLEDYREGPGASVSVVRDIGTRDYLLYVNARKRASTGSESFCRRMPAHLPVLACADPAEVLVINYGAGIVAGALSLHPSVKEIEVIEPSEAIIDVAPHFSVVNRQAGFEKLKNTNPVTSVMAGVDGRDYLNRTEKRYDVITLEPVFPGSPGDAYYFTSEFYALGLSRLKEGGVICQSIPLDALPLRHMALLLNTVIRTVPGTAMFLFDDLIVLLGFQTPDWRLDLNRIESLVNLPVVESDMEMAGLFSPLALAGAYQGDGNALDRILTQHGFHEAVLRDDCASIPFYGDTYLMEPAQQVADNVAFLLGLDASFEEKVRMDDIGPERHQEISSQIRAFSLSEKLFLRGREQETRMQLDMLSSVVGDRVTQWNNYYERAFFLNPENRRAARKYSSGLIREALSEMEHGRFALAHDLTRKAAAIAPELWDVYMAKGFLNLAAGNLIELEQVVEIMRQMQPFSTVTSAFKEKLAHLKGDEEQRRIHADLIARSGGVSPEITRWFELAEGALKAGKARYSVPSLDLVLELLTRGPDALTETGRRAWNVAASFDAELLARARDELLIRLENEDDLFVPAVVGMGFFKSELVRKRLGELFHTKSGAVRDLILESLARAGDTQEVIRVIENNDLSPMLRRKALQIASELKIMDALESLINLLESPDSSLRLSSFVALLNLTHVHFNYDPDADLPARNRSVEQWRQWYRIRSGIEEP